MIKKYKVLKYGDARGRGAIVQETIGVLWFTVVRTWTSMHEPGLQDYPRYDQWICRETGKSIMSHPEFGKALPAFYRANYNTRNKEESTCTTTSMPSAD
ncbi:hypothetical protein PP187_gp321 [Klebsiella phage vB_KvM-Eowyn]|uniref:Uncharacterized protein n=1 Tax=Klebsiella phage vB_KvM-Eowyn TaxID=2762819 RepID=A0A7R8R576_9CAUD|nr:hypothetical protein PP187_gp321 [Klebsiella phage vB_KvM-Eowyn]CAD5236310.1 hypothetical protein LLCLJKAH_00321 [Klebsiella phage vB_KvM-Eowyn]